MSSDIKHKTKSKEVINVLYYTGTVKCYSLLLLETIICLFT